MTKNRKPKQWERAYLRHVLYIGKTRAGEIRTGKPGEWDGVYRWNAGGFSGECGNLAQAKSYVEGAAIFGQFQLKLF